MQTKENEQFLHSQLITYIGNKRSLLPFIGQAISIVQKNLSKEKLSCLDLFSGSGIVARYLKQYSSDLTVNDLENYSCIINRCYLSNITAEQNEQLKSLHKSVNKKIESKMKQIESSRNDGTYRHPGFISELYSPFDINDIKENERCFYTPYNANFLDAACQIIQKAVPDDYKPFFLAPLLSEASIHANTAGIFKGFYKNSKTKIGQFGGNGKNALSRILGKITLPYPILSNFSCPFKVFNQNASELLNSKELYSLTKDNCFDLVYLDPPYNQHPYGSNYFMLNLIASYTKPQTDRISQVSGIPKDWNRSDFNKKKKVEDAFFELVQKINAKYILVSFNSEGFLTKEQMIALLSKIGKVQVLESQYNTFRGSRNLSERNIHVKEYLFLVNKIHHLP
ncbi:MAG: DNA adenine methylase [Treponema sp.]|nr:DNA adenine methylase [Treponema sp.]